MVDIDTQRIIDLINSRECYDVTKWLMTFPNIQIVARDGLQTYSKSIREAFPNPIQVSDRFRLLKNLTDYCKEYILKAFKYRIEIEKIDSKKELIDFKTIAKRERIECVHRLHSEGLSNYKICGNGIIKVSQSGSLGYRLSIYLWKPSGILT